MHEQEHDHERFMRRAIELAANAPGHPFGAVIVDVRKGEIVAEGWNKSEINPTWHGEMVALGDLFGARRSVDGGELALYTTAEPCPMCMSAILWCCIDSVVFGTSIQFLVDIGWKQIEISAQEIVAQSPGWRCAVIGGILGSECDELFLTVARAAPGR